MKKTHLLIIIAVVLCITLFFGYKSDTHKNYIRKKYVKICLSKEEIPILKTANDKLRKSIETHNATPNTIPTDEEKRVARKFMDCFNEKVTPFENSVLMNP
jgi:hypothetical protein